MFPKEQTLIKIMICVNVLFVFIIDKNISFQPYVCNGCYGLSYAMSFNEVAIVSK